MELDIGQTDEPRYWPVEIPANRDIPIATSGVIVINARSAELRRSANVAARQAVEVRQIATGLMARADALDRLSQSLLRRATRVTPLRKRSRSRR